MEILRTVQELREWARADRCETNTIGIVPTMGALHAGHATLIRAARGQCGLVIVSIFVNPTQFGPHEDYARYPRSFEADCALARVEGAGIIFAP
jgi:pantoate--beta-alanine ligase